MFRRLKEGRARAVVAPAHDPEGDLDQALAAYVASVATTVREALGAVATTSVDGTTIPTRTEAAIA